MVPLMVAPTVVPLLSLCATAPGMPIRARSATEIIIFFMSLLPSPPAAATNSEMHLTVHHCRVAAANHVKAAKLVHSNAASRKDAERLAFGC